LTLFTALGFTLGCADEAVLMDDGTMGPVETQTECPPEFYRPEEGRCLITDIEAYNRAMAANNGVLTDDDLLNVDNSDLEADQQTRLAQEGTGKFYIYTNETKRVGVRVINYVGVPVPNMEVSFSFSMEGTSDPLGSVISSQNAISDQFGVASVDITGGDIPTYFRLDMETSEGDTLSYGVSVIQHPFDGDIEQLPPG
jgi:hypothetical protein